MENSSKRIVIAGGTGTLGTACRKLFQDSGYDVVVLSRSAPGKDPGTVQWDPAQRTIADNVIDGAYAVLCLTGAPLDAKPWTSRYKKELRDSRVVPAEFLHHLISLSAAKPEVYVGASGVSIYGDTGSDPVSEHYEAHDRSFLVELGKEWERAHQHNNGVIRTAVLRTGIVLDRHSGFVKRLALPGSFGLFPYFGNGRQSVSWVHIHDYASMVKWIVEHPDHQGPFNVVSPDPATIRKVMATMRAARGGVGLVFGLPGWVAQLLFGEMSVVLLDSVCASSARIEGKGFRFSYGTLEGALGSVFGS